MDSNALSLIQELRDLRFASGLTDDIVMELAMISTHVEFQAGTVLFLQGGENSNLFLICSGRVGLDMFIPAHGSVRILTVSDGELLAWSALVGDCFMTATATALQQVRAIAIDGHRLNADFHAP
jgi:CRP-like cAMP-binding protein